MKNKKRLYAGVSVGVIAAFSVSLFVSLFPLMKSEKKEDASTELVNELTENEGTYDEKSIVLANTTPTRTEEIAERLHADYRISESGTFATITLEDTDILEIAKDTEFEDIAEEISPDYHAKVFGNVVSSSAKTTVTDEYYEKQDYLNYIHLDSVWENNKGTDVTIAVIDTGIDTDHPEFAGRILSTSYNATLDKTVADSDYSVIEDDYGHGTEVAGVIGASMNEEGIAGIAGEAKLMVIKAECNEDGEFARTSDLVFGLEYAINNGADIINMSFGVYADTNPFETETLNGAAAGIVMVASSGNDATSLSCYPAADENVIGVGAFDTDSSELACYSNTGDNVDMVAPGNVYTTAKDGSYTSASGTSFSSAIVTGAAALYKKAQGDKFDYATFEHRLYASDIDLGQSGKDADFGYGALNVQGLILASTGTLTLDYQNDSFADATETYVEGVPYQLIDIPELSGYLFENWYYDEDNVRAVNLYEDSWTGDITLYARWNNDKNSSGLEYQSLSDGTIEITGYNRNERQVIIPSQIDGKSVSSIGEEAFASSTRMRSVTLPENLTSIGDAAFRDCIALRSITLIDTVKTIGKYAFYGCHKLSAVSISDNAALEKIGSHAFAGCDELKEFTISKNLRELDGSFLTSTSLTSLKIASGNAYFSLENNVLFNASKTKIVKSLLPKGTASYAIPDSVKEIGAYAFYGSGLTSLDTNKIEVLGTMAFAFAKLKSVTLGASLTEINSSAFAYCQFTTLAVACEKIGDHAFEETTVSSLTILNTVKYIGDYAFAKSHVSTVTFEEGSQLLTLGEGSFWKCEQLQEISLPESLISVGEDAFYGASSLEKLTISSSAVRILDRAFAKTALKGTITLPKGVISLGEGVFCEDAVTSYAVEEGNDYYKSMDDVLFTKDGTSLVAYPSDKNRTAYEVPDTVREIKGYAFGNALRLTDITLNEGLKTIDSDSFHGSGIKAITIPSSVTFVGSNAFDQCDLLTSMTFEDGSPITRISLSTKGHDNIADVNYPTLTSLDFGKNNSITSIDEYALQDMRLVTSLDLSTTKITTLKEGCFSGLSSITSYLLPETLTTIEDYAFYYNTSLTSLTLPESVTSIGSYAFFQTYGTSKLSLYFEAEILPDGLSLSWDSGIRQYYIGVSQLISTTEYEIASLKSGAYSFIQYKGTATTLDLTSIGYSIKTIGPYAFDSSSVETVLLPETLVNIGSHAFSNSKLTSITIPENVTFIGQYAFSSTPLTGVTFSGNPKIQKIEKYAFKGTTKLTSFTLPASVTSLGKGMFENSGLTSFDFGSNTGVDSLPDFFFMGSKLASVTLPNNIITIGNSSFRDSSLTSLVLGSGVTSIGDYAFYNSSLKEIEIPSQVTAIGAYAFGGMKGTTSFSVSENNANYASKDKALFDKNFLTLLAYPTGETGSYTLPSSVTTIGNGAFEYSSLSSISLEGSALQFIGDRAFIHSSLTSFAVPSSVLSIGSYAFAYDRQLVSFSYAPENRISSVKEGTFYGDASLRTLSNYQTITEIGDYALYGCDSLETMDVSGMTSLQQIGSYAFAYASIGDFVTVPSTVTEIGSYAFQGSSFHEFTVSNEKQNELTIGQGILADCDSLEEITLPFIGSRLNDRENTSFTYFFGYRNNALYVPSTIKEITLTGDMFFIYGEFSCCSGLEKINLPDTVYIVFRGAFYETSATYEIKNPVVIGYDKAMRYCYSIFTYRDYGSGLTGTLTLSDHVHSIDLNYSRLPSGLDTLIIPETVTSIGNLSDITVKNVYLRSEYIRNWQFWHIENLYIADTPEGFVNNYSLQSMNCAVTDWYFWSDDEGTSYEKLGELASLTLDCGNLDSKMQNASKFSSIAEIRYDGDLASWLGDVSSMKNHSYLSSVLKKTGKFYLKNEDGNFYLPTSVTISDEKDYSGAFAYLSSVKEMIFAEGITSVNARIFEGTKLDRLVLPSTIATGVTCDFEAKEIDYAGSITDYLSVSTGIYQGIFSNGSVYLCNDSGNWYSPETLVIPEGVTEEIPGYAFAGFTSLKEVVIPDGITIGQYSFARASSLEKLTLKGNSALSSCSLSGCTSLEELTFETPFIEGDTSIPSLWHYFFASWNESIASLPLKKIVYTGTELPENFFSSLPAEEIDVSHLTSLSAGLFNGCTNLRTLHLPEQVTDGSTNSIFCNCTSLISVSVPSGITEIGNAAFYGCSSLTSVILPDSLTSIGDSAFRGCTSLKWAACGEVDSGRKVMELPEGVTSIGNDVFVGLTLDELILPSTLTTISSNAFSGGNITKITNRSSLNLRDYNLNLTYSLIVNADGTSYYYNQFDNETYVDGDFVYRLTGNDSSPYCLIQYLGSEECVTLPSSVLGKTYSVDSRCNLSKIIIPGAMKDVPAYFLQGNTSLTSVTIDEGIETIGGAAFADCDNLTEIIIDENNTHFTNGNGVIYDDSDNFIGITKADNEGVYVFLHNINTQNYSVNGKELIKEVNIADEVTVFHLNFSNCPNLTKITFPENMTATSCNDFSSCSSLKEITLPGCITSLASFRGCTALESIVIPNSVRNMNGGCFAGCTSLKSVTLSTNVTSIPDGCFDGCSDLESIDLSHITSIGQMAFRNCTSLKNVIFSSDSESSFAFTGSYAFEGCSSLEEVTLPASIKTFALSYFDGCTSLKTIIVPESVKEFDGSSSSLQRCSFTNLYFEGTMEEWCTINFDYLSVLSRFENFYVQGKLVEGTLKLDGLTSISDYAFAGYKKITGLVLSSTLTSIGSESFFYVPLTTVYLQSRDTDLSLSNLDSVTTLIIDAFTDGEFHYTDIPSFSNLYFNGDISEWLACAEVLGDELSSNVTLFMKDGTGYSTPEEICIPEGVTAIPNRAFYLFKNLKKVTLPSTLVSIGNYAFAGCPLDEIQFPASLLSIGDHAFEGCLFTELKLPENLEFIGDYAFNKCTELSNTYGYYSETPLEIPASVNHIGGGGLGGASVLFCSMPAYYGVSATGRIHLSTEEDGILRYADGVTEISTGEPGTYYLPSSVTKINILYSGQTSTIYYDGSLSDYEKIEISGTICWHTSSYSENPNMRFNLYVKENGQYVRVNRIVVDEAFKANYNGNNFHGINAEIVINNLEEDIDFSNTFFADLLKNVSLIKNKDNYVFSDAFRAKYDSISTENDIITGIKGSDAYVLYIFDDTAVTIDSFASSTTVLATSGVRNVIISEGVTTIPNNAFSECTSLENVSLPSTVTSIGSKAFYHCTSLKTINFPGDLETIGNNAFEGCSSLISADFPQTLTSIGKAAFYDCSSLTGIDLPDTLTSIGEYAFAYCSSIGEISIPDAIVSIPGSIFRGCSSLTLKTLSDTVQRIGESAFNGCSSLEISHLPENLTTIGSAAFAGCSKLTGSLNLSGNINTVSAYAFRDTGYDHITIGMNVISIGEDAFKNTPYEQNKENWSNGLLVIDGCLVEVADKSTKSLLFGSEVRLVYSTLYEDLPSVERVSILGNGFEWSQNKLSKCKFLTSITLVTMPSVIYNLPSSVTTIIISKNANVTSASAFNHVTGVRILVEADKEDVNWDSLYAGWNHDNEVYYGDEWQVTDFYDEDGNLLSFDYYLNSEVIRLPYVTDIINGSTTSSYVGWDIDGDGKADALPSASASDISAYLVRETHPTSFRVVYYDEGKLYAETTYGYNETLVLPENPSRTGYVFNGWIGYEENMKVTSDLLFRASWSHVNGDHDYVKTVLLPTCEDEGYDHYECSICGASYNENYTAASGHTVTDFTVIQNPTCENEGTKEGTCSTCGKKVQESIPATGHTLDGGTVIKAATCTEEGTRKYTCSVCQESVQESIEKTRHSYTKYYLTSGDVDALINEYATLWYSKDAGGYYVYQCSECKEFLVADTANVASAYSYSEKTETVTLAANCLHEGYSIEKSASTGTVMSIVPTDPKTSHTAGTAVIENRSESTCIAEGSYDEVVYCSVCGGELSRITHSIAKISHDYADDVTLPTCTEGGYTTHTCTYCGDTYTDSETPALGHHYEETVILPTCTEEGYSGMVCSVCGDAISKTNEVPALGHDLVHHEAKEATCKEIGWEAYDTCSRCDYSTYVEIPLTGQHTPGDPVLFNDSDASCIQAGSYDEVVYCSVCGIKLSETHYEGTVTPHSYYYQYRTEPTCTEEGYSCRVCNVCGDTVSEVIPSLGHSYGVLTETSSSCTVPGEIVYICSRCGETYFVEKELLSHTEEPAVTENKVAATCFTEGSYEEVIYCSVCGEEISRKKITEAKLEHDYKTTVIAAKCTSSGYTLHTCSLCGESYKDNETPALGHTPGDWIIEKEPTSKEEGYELKICTVCGEIVEEQTIAKLTKNGCFGNITGVTTLLGTLSFSGIGIFLKKRKETAF